MDYESSYRVEWPSGPFLDGWIKIGRTQFKNSGRWLRVEVSR